MNLILLSPEDFLTGTDRVQLTGRRLKHVLEVHRASVGDELIVGVLNGRIGSGRIAVLDTFVLEMDVRLDRDPPPALPVTLILAMPRPKVLRRVLRSVCSMGVKRIILLGASRVEKSFWQTPFLGDDAVREQLMLGLEQARDTMLPDVQLRKLFKPFVEDELPDIIKGTKALVAHPGAAEPLPRAEEQAVTLAVGPEGGFLPYEIEMMSACGFTPVSIGERILHVETAVPALLSRLF